MDIIRRFKQFFYLNAYYVFIQFVLVSVLLLGCTNSKQAKPLKPISVATGNWEPYVGENLTQNGPVAQMMSVILMELGYLPVFKYYEWGFVDTHLETGYPSFAFPYLMSNDTKRFKYSDPIVNIDYVLFYYNAKDNNYWKADSIQEITHSNKRIGRIRGYSKLPGIQTDSVYIEVSSAIEGFNMLLDGRIDYLLEAKHVGQQLTLSGEIPADSYHFGYLGQAKLPIENDDTIFVKNLSFRIKFSPKVSDEFISEINNAINACVSSDYYKSLEAKVNNTQDKFLKAYLVVNPKNSLIYGYTDDEKKQPEYLIPTNTKVVVLKWNDIFETKINKKDKLFGKNRSKVKLLNGPLKGKILWIENEQIALEKK